MEFRVLGTLEVVHDGRLVKLEFPPNTFAEIEDYLRVMGIRAFTYFPDLEGLALDHEARTAATIRDTKKFFSAG